MTFKIDPLNLQNLCRRYESGENAASLASELGVTHKVIIRILGENGVHIRSKREALDIGATFSPAQLSELHLRYLAGESSPDIAKSIGCPSATLRTAWKRHGFAVRNISEGNALQAARANPAVRAARAVKAHDAARGRIQTHGEKIQRALTRESRKLGISDQESRMVSMLTDAGIACRTQVAVGPYNVDILAGDRVAVEIFGGFWHGYGKHAASHKKRFRHILDAGFSVIIIWIAQANESRWIRYTEEIVSLMEFVRSNPTAPSQYRMVWCNGDLVLALDGNTEDLPIKPVCKLGRDASGRYYRAG